MVSNASNSCQASTIVNCFGHCGFKKDLEYNDDVVEVANPIQVANPIVFVVEITEFNYRFLDSFGLLFDEFVVRKFVMSMRSKVKFPMKR